jgi:hypothetical protein
MAKCWKEPLQRHQNAPTRCNELVMPLPMHFGSPNLPAWPTRTHPSWAGTTPTNRLRCARSQAREQRKFAHSGRCPPAVTPAVAHCVPAGSARRRLEAATPATAKLHKAIPDQVAEQKPDLGICCGVPFNSSKASRANGASLAGSLRLPDPVPVSNALSLNPDCTSSAEGLFEPSFNHGGPSCIINAKLAA